MSDRDWATAYQILRVVGGSHAYGTATPDSDTDLRAVALPPVSWLVGFPPGDVGSQTKDVHGAEDLVVHTLAKFCRLALRCNPNLLEILWAADAAVQYQTRAGRDLRAMAPKFLSRQAYAAFSGYAFSQLKRARSHNTDHGTRQDAVTRFGYDPKNAMNLLRLERMGHELVTAGRVNVRRADAAELLAVRRGERPWNDVVAEAEALDRASLAALAGSPLPEEPDREGVEAWLMATQAAWVAGDRSGLTPC